MRRESLIVVVALTIMSGCTTNKEPCVPGIKFVKQEFPRLETVELNSSIDIPTYTIPREEISVKDGNVSMTIETFKKVKDGDSLKVEYLLRRLKLFIFGLSVMNEQVKKYNKEFVDGVK